MFCSSVRLKHSSSQLAGKSIVELRKLNRSGLAACAVYLVAIIWLFATHYPSAQTAAIDAPQFWLLTYPLAFLGVTLFGPEEFWTKYQLFFFPACLPFFYLLGCGIGWIMGFEKLRKPPDRP